MPTPAEVRKVVESIVGTKGDETVLEYVVSILEDGEFEYGTDGEEAFEAFGAVLVKFCLAESLYAELETLIWKTSLHENLPAGERRSLQQR